MRLCKKLIITLLKICLKNSTLITLFTVTVLRFETVIAEFSKSPPILSPSIMVSPHILPTVLRLN